jgi:hypothetical protein
MSIHAKNTPEAHDRLRKQKAKARLLSMLVACLIVLLLATVLALFSLPVWPYTAPVIVTYARAVSEDLTLDERKVVTQIQRKPSAPSQNMAKVIATNVASPVAIPIPEVVVTEPTLDFGDSMDFGDGWGDGSGIGIGGGASFFGQKVEAKRIAYVIDYSHSMRGRREQLMRKELAKSVSALTPGVQYQLIFFAGPAWVAGDEVKIARGNKQATVTAGRKTYDWISKSDAHDWQVRDPKKVQKPKWLDVSSSTIKKSLKQIKETKLVWGTVWQPSVEMALRLDPAPQVIYFMTDGLTGGDPVKAAKHIADLARRQNVIINTVALMQPRAREAMIAMADQTGGQATLINENGEQVKLLSKNR